MKLHSCIHCGERFETYTAFEEHVRTHANACSKCNRVFTRPTRLLAHKCKVGDYLCESCQHTFYTQTRLDRHKRETSCHFNSGKSRLTPARAKTSKGDTITATIRRSSRRTTTTTTRFRSPRRDKRKLEQHSFSRDSWSSSITLQLSVD